MIYYFAYLKYSVCLNLNYSVSSYYDEEISISIPDIKKELSVLTVF